MVQQLSETASRLLFAIAPKPTVKRHKPLMGCMVIARVVQRTGVASSCDTRQPVQMVSKRARLTVVRSPTCQQRLIIAVLVVWVPSCLRSGDLPQRQLPALRVSCCEPTPPNKEVSGAKGCQPPTRQSRVTAGTRVIEFPPTPVSQRGSPPCRLLTRRSGCWALPTDVLS